MIPYPAAIDPIHLLLPVLGRLVPAGCKRRGATATAT
jgi:hypothetical protein